MGWTSGYRLGGPVLLLDVLAEYRHRGLPTDPAKYDADRRRLACR